MLHLETNNIYEVNPSDRSLDFRNGKIDPVDHNQSFNSLAAPFYASGVRKYDLAVFATALTFDGARDYSFLVVSSCQDQGLLVTDDFIRLATDASSKSASAYLTPELAKKFATLNDEEIAQLGIEDIVSSSAKMYPGIRGFTR